MPAGELAEAMRAVLNGAEVLDWEYFESTWNEFTTEMSAHIFLCVCEHCLPPPSDTTILRGEFSEYLPLELAGV